MKIKNISIKNFRGIENENFSISNLSILIGNNGTSKTTILEAIHYCLSPYFISNRIKYTDFFKGTENPIEIILTFDNPFIIKLPDAYATQDVPCSKIKLEIKKRDSNKGIQKAFSDPFVIKHYPIPDISPSEENKWSIKRKSNTYFKFEIRQLESAITNIPIKSFYFDKNRDRQITKGFNSSISSVFDDFNWRFVKSKMKNPEHTFQQEKQKIEATIINSIEEETINKTIKTLNKKLEDIISEGIDLSFIDDNIPFDNAFFINKVEGFDLPISKLGSGFEMFIALMFLETLASLSKDNIILLIDEPELHLHPKLQDKLIKYIKDISSTNQTILSTHSPFFFKNCQQDNNISLITRGDNKERIGLFPWSPSWGEINYFIYNFLTIEFFNELYGYIQELTECYCEADIENYFIENGVKQEKNWIAIKKGIKQQPRKITIISYIRNFIHHPENIENLIYSNDDFENSINLMLDILKSAKPF